MTAIAADPRLTSLTDLAPAALVSRFRSSRDACAPLGCELRNQRDTGNSSSSSVVSDLKFLNESAGENGRNFKSTTLAPTSARAGKAHQQAQDFEAMFLSSMFQNMFTAIGEDGPLGSSNGVAPWRSFLTQEFGKAFAKSGGVGLADHVYRSLMAHQEARNEAPGATMTQQ